MSIIETKNLSFSYGDRSVLSGLDLNIEKGSFTAVAGPNGAGKSTLLNLLCGMLKPAAGTISVNSKSLSSYKTSKLAEHIAVVRQEYIPVFGFTVYETVITARIPHFGKLGFEKEIDRQIVTNALRATETLEFASRTLDELSGGERQRVFIARALAQDTEILLLDEPTSFLDFKHQVAIYDLLKNAQKQSEKTIVTVTHDINLAARYCDQALLLSRTEEHCFGKIEDVFTADRISQFFDVKLLSAQIDNKPFFIPKS